MGREKRGIITIQEKCPYVEKCGACHMGQTTYEEELAAKKELVKSFKIWIYNEDTGRGILRHVLVRKGMSTKQVMVVLVTACPEFPHKNNFVAELRKRHPEITTIVQNINGANTYFYLKVKEGHPGSLQ